MDARPRAALLLGAGLVALPLARPLPEATPCRRPAELAARGEHTSEAGCAGGAPVRGPARVVLGLGLDPNRADAETLAVLPGIGPRRAAAIAAARCARPFARPRDLERVPGIGPRTRAGLEGWIAKGPLAAPDCRAGEPAPGR